MIKNTLSKTHGSYSFSNQQFASLKLNRICTALSVVLPMCFMLPSTASTVTQKLVFKSTNQSMWGTGASTVFSNFDDPIFLGAEWDNSGKLFEIGNATNGNNGVRVDGTSSGKIGLETGWSIDSGTVNTQLPFSFELDIPDRRDLIQGSSFTFGVTKATLDSQAFLETISPSLQLYADLIVNANASLDVKGCYDAFFASDCGSASVNLLDFNTTRELISVNTGPDRSTAVKDGQVRVLDGFKELFAAGATAKDLIETEKDEDGKTKKVSIKLEPTVNIGGSPLVEVDVRIPDITEKSTLSTNVDVGSGGIDDILSTSGSDEFLNLDVDIDQLGTNLRILPPLGGNASVDFGVGSISSEFDLLDLSFTPSLSLDQDFSISIDRLGVSYEIERFDLSGNLVGSQQLVANSLTDQLSLLWNDSENINITPTYEISASLQNETGLSVNFDFNVDILKGSISAEVFGIELGSASFGPLAQLSNFDLPSADLLTLFNNSFGLEGFSALTGETIGLGLVNRTFDGSGTNNWGQSSSWVENLVPDDFANVQVINGEVFVTDNQQSSDLSVDSGAIVDITGTLVVEGSNISNNGTIQVTGKSFNPSVGRLEINATNLSGNGDIVLQSGFLTSSDSSVDRFIRGQNIVVEQSFISRVSIIRDISLRLSNGSSIVNNSNRSLLIRNAEISSADDNAFALNGTTLLVDSTLSNIDLAENATLNISSNSPFTPNNSFWNLGNDAIASIGNGAEIIVSSSDTSTENSLTLLGQKNGVAEINNNGRIEISSEFSQPGAVARMNLSADKTLFSGNGSIELIDGAIFGDSGDQGLYNEIGHTIKGTGFLYLNRGAIINDGQIWSEKLTTDPTTSNSLFLFGKLTNNGIIGARGTDQVFTLDNSEGITNITLSNAVISPSEALGSMTLTGGTWEAQDGALLRFDVEHAINNFFTNRSTLVLDGQASDIIINGPLQGSQQALLTRLDDGFLSFNNQGTLTLINNDFTSSNMFNTGVINMSSFSFLSGLDVNQGTINSTFGSEITELKRNASGALIEGSAFLTNARGLINDGTIRANDSLLWLLLGSGNDVAFTNNANMESVDGGFLRLTGLHERNGQQGQAEFAGGNSWGVYASNDSRTAIAIEARGSGDNQGIKSIFDTDLTLSGMAAHFYTQVNSNLIDLAESLEFIDKSASLTLANGQVFQSSKQLTNKGTLKLTEATYVGSSIVNDGSIVGHGSIVSNITNNQVIKAEGGQLTISGSIDNANGLIEVGSGGINSAGEKRDVLNITSNFVQGGKILIKENATLKGASSYFDTVLTNKGTIAVNSNVSSSFLLAAGSTNTGVISANNGARAFFGDFYNNKLNNTSGKISADNGELALLNYTISGGEIELTGNQSELSGTGVLQNVFLNLSKGIVSAENSIIPGINTLTISTSQAAKLNDATLQANNGAVLVLQNAEIDGAGGSVILAKNNGSVELSNVILDNLTLATEGSGKITDTATSHFSNMHLAGTIDVAQTGELNLYETNILSGSLTANGGSEIVMHNARLTGQNVATQNIDDQFDVLPVVTPGDLIITNGAFLRGSGSIDLVNLTNVGSIIADDTFALTIDVFGDQFENSGVMRATGNGGMVLLDEYVVNKGTVVVDSNMSVNSEYKQISGETIVNGRLSSGSVIMLDGSLSGIGAIESNVYIDEMAELNMLARMDSLAIDGDMELYGTLSVDLFSLDTFDTLTVADSLTFGDTTQFIFDLAEDIELFDNLVFEFLFFDEIFNLDLFSRSNVSFNREIDGFEWLIALNEDETSLSLIFVNAPAQTMMLLFGLAYLIRRTVYNKQ